eukprot:2033639-Rhodomonas_salina.2
MVPYRTSRSTIRQHPESKLKRVESQGTDLVGVGPVVALRTPNVLSCTTTSRRLSVAPYLRLSVHSTLGSERYHSVAQNPRLVVTLYPRISVARYRGIGVARYSRTSATPTNALRTPGHRGTVLYVPGATRSGFSRPSAVGPWQHHTLSQYRTSHGESTSYCMLGSEPMSVPEMA